MAGTVRKTHWTTRQGEVKSTWTADYFDQHRKRHTKNFATKKAADAWLLKVRGELRDGIHTPEAGSITIAEAARLWLTRCERDGRERCTLQQYDTLFRLHIKPHLGAGRLAQLTPPQVESYRDELLGKLSRSRTLETLGCLKSILANAQRLGLVVHNAAAATRVDLKKRERELLVIGRDIPSKAEVQAILAAASERWRPMLITAAFTGMRASELRGLSWSDVNLTGKTVRVRQRADFWGTLGATKSAAGRREIPLSPPVVDSLRQWRIAYPYGSDGIVFCTHNRSTKGSVLGHAELWKVFRKAQVAAAVVDGEGKPKYRFHALRHFFASTGIEVGFAPKRLQALLGHASITMTYDVYGHLFPNPEDDHARLATIARQVMGK